MHNAENSAAPNFARLDYLEGFRSPSDGKLLLKLVFWYIQLVRLQNGGLGSNSVVVLINQLFLVNRWAVNLAIGDNGNFLLGKGLLDQLNNSRCVCVWLDEHKYWFEKFLSGIATGQAARYYI